jgi:hypothetical protein
MIRESGPDFAGLRLAHDRESLQAFAVIRDPVHELISEAAEFLGVHARSFTGTMSLRDLVM